MPPKKQRDDAKSALELVEEALHLVRCASVGTWTAYLLGALPFTLGLLFFWSEMSQSGYAWQNRSMATLGMAGLFIWLKCWQTVFCRLLRAQLSGSPVGKWTMGRLWRLLAVQATWQSSGLFLLPLIAVVVIPFGQAFAFYQNLTVLGDGEQVDLRQVMRAALSNARLWPRQNYLWLSLLALITAAIWINVVSALVAGPQLVKIILGIETVFTRSSDPYLNTTFMIGVLCLTWIGLDPLIKAVHVLRCFYGSSVTSGEDLRTSLRRFHIKGFSASLLLALLVIPASLVTSCAASTNETHLERTIPSTVTSKQLDQAIADVLEQREYTWRIPKEEIPLPDEEKKKGFLANFLAEIGKTLERWGQRWSDWMDRFGRWIDNLFKQKPLEHPDDSAPRPTNWRSPLRLIFLALLVALAIILGIFLYRVWQKRRRVKVVEAIPAALVLKPDLNHDYVSANELPEDQWLQLAKELMTQGNFRLALRALYLASLSNLAERKLIAIAKFKSNRDYERELTRRAHALPSLVALFHDNVLVFDRAWYGIHEVSMEMLNQFQSNVEQIRAA